MGEKFDTVLDRLMFRRSLARWQRAAERAGTTDLPTLRGLRGQARQLRRAIDRVLHVADGRLTLPAIGSDAIRKPLLTDWAWRPEIWRGPVNPPGLAAVENRASFGGETTVFHDCRTSELTLRQIRNGRATDLAPFGLRMDVFRFDGSFLSLVIDLPDAAVQGLRLSHVIRLDAVVEMERPLEIFARINIKHGPNSEQIVRELPLGTEDVMVEFDLAYTRMNEKRVERAWIDLIFEGPEMNQIVLRDVTLSRRPRAEL
ncbi:MAG: hypothetical protein H5U18_05585 [Rhodobacteraceae bacterium]|nr:hypothetical protein [Paracoccaceae bacterium]